MTANIIAIGDELLYGQTQDTNSNWIAAQMSQLGIAVRRIMLVADKKEDIIDALTAASADAELVLITGGLGPTTDDLTKGILAEYFGVETQLHEEALKEVSAFFETIGKELSDTNREQAVLPINCEPLSNRLGTAPGMWFDVEDTVYVSMPGVPFEMREMMGSQVIPKVQERFELSSIIHRHLNTVGIGESFLSDKLSGFEEQLPPHIKLAYLPGLGTVKLRLTSTTTDGMDAQFEKLNTTLAKYVFGKDAETLEEVLGKHLTSAGKTLSTAESCTGGYIAHQLTSVPGSSDYYKGSVVSYANEIKTKLLGVSQDSLDKQGAVSREVVQQMVQGVRKHLNTELGIAVSGIAGPSGGTPEKPVGTVWIAVADEAHEYIKEYKFGTDRDKNIRLTAITAMDLARRLLLGIL